MKIDDMYECYRNNKDFKEFVDKCSRTYRKDISHIMQQPITLQYYQYLNKVGEYDEHGPK